jgi:hypothetical protein
MPALHQKLLSEDFEFEKIDLLRYPEPSNQLSLLIFLNGRACPMENGKRSTEMTTRTIREQTIVLK